MRKISVNYTDAGKKLDRFYAECVSAGRAGELLRMEPMRQLEEVKKACGFRYLRFHGLLFEDMGVYWEDKKGDPHYNWQYVDMLYDSLLRLDIRPFVELSFTPKAMASGEDTVMWWRANITPPKDYRLWYDFIRALVSHWEKRYGREEVKQWYFEVWNEPNHPGFYKAGMEEYFRLYDTTCKAVKDVCSQYRVGGPATAGNEWIEEMIRHCEEEKVPLDFVSTHAYGVFGDFDDTGEKVLYLKEDKDAILKEVQMVYDQVKSSSMPDLEIHYTEWNSSFSPVDPIHDCYIQAAYLLYHLKRLSGRVNSMSYWAYTDIIEELGVPKTPFHGGFGMVTMQGYHKPSYYAYEFLNRLGKTELDTGDADSIAAKKEDGSIQVLLWNYTKPEQKSHNMDYFTWDLKAEEAEGAAVSLRGLPSGAFRLSVYQVGYGVNDVYTFYKQGNYTDLPTREEEERLRRRADGSPIRTELVEIPESGEWKMEISLRENDVYFLTLEPR